MFWTMFQKYFIVSLNGKQLISVAMEKTYTLFKLLMIDKKTNKLGLSWAKLRTASQFSSLAWLVLI